MNRWLACGLVFLLASRCKTRSYNTSQVAHVSGGGVKVPEGPHWIEGRQAFATIPAFTESVARGKPLPPEHPLSRRFNEWATLIDTNLRKEGVIGSYVPVPQVVVVQNPDANAYVTSADLCLDIPIVPVDNPSLNPEPGVTGRISTPTIRQDRLENDGVRMLPCRPTSTAEFHAIAKYFAAQKPYLGCEIKGDGGKLFLSKDCFRDIDYDDNDNRMRSGEPSYWSSSNTVMKSTLNVIFLMTGLIEKAGDERQVVSTLTHEMGHYYGAHQSELLDLPSYPYFHAEKPGTGRPEPASIDSKSRTAEILRNIGSKTDSFPKYAWQKVGTVTWPALYKVANWTVGNWQGERCLSGDCTPACAQLAKDLLLPDLFPTVKHLGQKPIFKRNYSPAFISSYQRLETSISTCLAGLDTSSKTYEMVQFSSPWSRFGAPGAKNVWEVVVAMDARNEQVRNMAQSAADEARAMRIGYYSIEQEADEFGTEALVYGGIDAAEAVKSALARGWGTPAVGAPDFKLCHQMARSRWKNPDGTWQILTPFDLDGDAGMHHDACYRAYNIAREVEAHPEYAKKKFNSLPAINWHELRKSAPTN